jgi:hypothetical protein
LAEEIGKALGLPENLAVRFEALEQRQAEPGPAGRDGRDGRDGVDGKDGKKGKDGVDGKDGADGFSLEDFDVEFDGERSFTFVFARGDKRKERTITAAWPLDRGVFRSETSYKRGDAVTFGGAIWIAQKDISETETTKPGDSGSGWRLSVKQGRHGAQGPAGPKGADGKDGRNGRDWGR